MESEGRATFVSDRQTAPDGLATYQIAFDVTPPSGRSIRSGITGTAGTSSDKSWGIGPEDTLFTGSENDASAQLSNLRVINFNAKGGKISLFFFADLSFTAITIANGQSAGRDAVQVSINGGAAQSRGNLANNPDLHRLGRPCRRGCAGKALFHRNRFSRDRQQVVRQPYRSDGRFWWAG